MTVISVAARLTKYLFCMCDSTVESDVGKGDFSLVGGRGILHVCGCTHVRLRVSPAMDCYIII